MADASKQAWNEVASRFSSVGKRLADRYQAGAKDEASTKEAQHKVEEVAREIGNQLDRAFDALLSSVKYLLAGVEPDAVGVELMLLVQMCR